MSYNGLDGFKKIFLEGENNYNNHGHLLENFRDTRNNPMIYSFCINGGTIDQESLDNARKINESLYNRFMNQKKKKLTGYKGIEDQYEEFDDHDCKHILILTILFNNNIDINNIVEIGGGYGNCIRLVNNIIDYEQWEIIDIPHMLTLQKYFLENEIEDISKLKFTNAYKTLEYKNSNIDLVIATHSLSELDWNDFVNYMENLVKYSKYFYYGFNKNCPSPNLINKKLEYINSNNYSEINMYAYTEKSGANVVYILYKNHNE